MIVGKKVLIRPLEHGDEKYLSVWWNHNDMMAHAGLAYGTLQSETAIMNQIDNEINQTSLFPNSKRFLILKKETESPIGEINYCGYNARNQTSEFGIKICDLSEQNKGYGKDALIIFIDFMFKFLNLNKIELTSMIDNEKAHHLYHSLGFKEIGIIRQSSFDSRTGEFSDVLYMDLLKSEWLDSKIYIDYIGGTHG